jgi:hypothetical protein
VNESEEQIIRDADRINKIGLLAQDVYEVLPEVVAYDDSTDIYSVYYTRLIPVLVEAIKEQQLQIVTLQSQIQSMIIPDPDFKAASIDEELTINQQVESSELFQNTPNPFTEETIIKYILEESVGSAKILVYDLTGKQLKNYELYENGSRELRISAGEFDPGTYLYTLMADGKVIGSRQMIITD